MPGRILAIGGYSPRFDDAVLELGGRRVCLVPTANPDPELVRLYASFARRAEPSHVSFDPWPRADREHVLSRDAIYVAGGNTANALAISRARLRRGPARPWEQDILLCGWSTGMICWFEAGVTDSFGPQLAGMRDGLGFLPGSACPHYDGEERRRPVYRELVADGFPPGYAPDDSAALFFEGTALREVVVLEASSTAYRVESGSETPLEARILSDARAT